MRRDPTPSRTSAVFALAALALILMPRARAELLEFKEGGRVQVAARLADGAVTVEAPFGTFRFAAADFRAIVPGSDPSAEWPRRRAEALRAGAGARVDAAWWALVNGLVPEAVAMTRDARDADPNDPVAARLAALADRLGAPCPDRDPRPLRAALGAPFAFEEARSAHVLLLHRLDPTEARERLDLLETVVNAYYLWFAFHGLDLAPPAERLVSVYYPARAPYVRFLEANDAGAFRTTLGYFHPTHHIVVGYDLRETEAWKARRARFNPSAHPGRDADRLRLLYETDYRAYDHGTAAHEMVHLLVARSGLVRDPTRLPRWLHEGLAAQFEVVRGGRWAGISRANDLRLADWSRLEGPPRLARFADDRAFARGYRGDVYAMAWAFVYFLESTRPEALTRLVDLWNHDDPTAPDRRGPRPTADALGLDPDTLDADWAAFMKTVRPSSGRRMTEERKRTHPQRDAEERGCMTESLRRDGQDQPGENGQLLP